MRNAILETLIVPLKEFYENVIDFLPDLLASLLIFILGVLIAVALKMIFARLFKVIKVDKFSEKFGITDIFQKGGIKDSVSNLFARVIGWITIFAFLIVSLQTLNVPIIEGVLEKSLLYLPNIFIAILILFVGYFLSNFVGRTALIASVNAGLKISGGIGKFAKLTVFALAITMALEQLGIGKETVLIAFAIIYGGIVLAFAIAFGVGGKDAAKNYIDKRIKGEEEKDDIQHL